MSNRKKALTLFLNDKGRVEYNKLCLRCVHNCKQSFRAVIIECRRFKKLRLDIAAFGSR